MERGIQVHRSDPSLEGEFNTGLLRAVKRYQRNHGLDDDGVAGPRTQLTILAEAAMKADQSVGLPDGLSLGFVVWEGGSVLAATNWDVPGGVDCGPAQRRCIEPLRMVELRESFDPWAELKWAADRFARECVSVLEARPGFARGDRHLRIAALAHNAPFLRDQILEAHPAAGAVFPRDYLRTPDALAGWTRNPSTGGPYTHAEWAVVYPGRVTSFIA